ncbi:hypothetical protein GL218_04399 [Daldinia childiae]|uniref:uncharacterized protein n=1 Tax=Daldinia childiae TaxID=326645 RepID=UPI001447A434|nr:uncharacterized protein GL218_04399 [Daldinia childiae]KAF3059948.1 hypothetical protein GL218_04399 [Daldinia childiae]
MTITPPGLNIETITNSQLTANTWITTIGSDTNSTVVPVLVGCPGCGGDRSGIVIWNLPEITGVEFDFPDLPSLPKFQRPCIQVLGVSAGNCQGPETNAGDDGDSDNNPSSTKRDTSTESQSTCTKTKTASDCAITCTPTTGDPSNSSITCFTTVCSQTTIGCDVTGTTITTTSTTPCITGLTGVGRRADDCKLSCPNYDVDPKDENIPDKRNLAKRASKRTIAMFGKCKPTTPKETQVAIPTYPAGVKFWKDDRDGFKQQEDGPAKDASISVPRWYSTTIDEYACTPVVTKVAVEEYKNGDQRTNQPRDGASMNHSWEKGWLTEFFETTISKDAPSDTSKVNNVGDGKLTCDEFNEYIFDSGEVNLLSNIFSGLPSDKPGQMEFIGMTSNLNDFFKVYFY